jgi:hypothetical protein
MRRFCRTRLERERAQAGFSRIRFADEAFADSATPGPNGSAYPSSHAPDPVAILLASRSRAAASRAARPVPTPPLEPGPFAR